MNDMLTIACKNKIYTNIEAIIFDKDGTLEDSHDFWREIGIKRSRLIDAQIPGIGEPLLMAFGISENTLDLSGLLAVGNRYENEIAAAAYIAETGRSWFEAKEIAHNAFLEADKYLDSDIPCPLFAGSLEVLKSLSSAGLKLGILSSDFTNKVEIFVGYHQISPYIKLKMGYDSELTKPNPDLFLVACQKLGVQFDRTLMVGDSQGDLIMAKKAGAAGAIGICWKKDISGHLQAADVVISRLEDIKIHSS
jgi:phosphoglycolate phosphatase